MSDLPADILRRLRPIPTTTGPPTTAPRDIVGTDLWGMPCTVEVLGSAAPVLLLFLSAGCTGCRDLWEGLAALRDGLGPRARLAVITKGEEAEDAAALRALVGVDGPPAGVAVVLSSTAWSHYRVAGPPFMALADAQRVRMEGVAWGLDETLRAALIAVGEG